jgi:hypothetical protein
MVIEMGIEIPAHNSSTRTENNIELSSKQTLNSQTKQIKHNRNRIGDDQIETNEWESRQLARRQIKLINNSR